MSRQTVSAGHGVRTYRSSTLGCQRFLVGSETRCSTFTTGIDLIKHGFKVIVVDDNSNSSPKCIDQVRKICDTDIPFYNFELRDANCLDELFKSVDIDAVVHFAGYKAVGESVAKLLKYYDNNLKGINTLLETMASNGVHDIVCNSSATVYGTPQVIPISESEPRGEATNDCLSQR